MLNGVKGQALAAEMPQDRILTETDGPFAQVDGWKLIAFKRSRGIQYLDRAVAPDGRVGTYDAWSEREDNPVYMLSDDEQDRLDDVIEGSEPS
jgi:Tat protein secretion system quality control protein TatD with DNase activity